MLHSKSASETINVIDSGTALPQVETRKLLGVIIDSKLTFSDQIAFATSKADSALNSISKLLSVTSTEVGLMIARSLATTHIERTYPVWCFSAATMKTVEQYHRRVLIRCTGAMKSTSTAQLEVVCNVPPIALRLQEIVVLEFARTCRIPGPHPLKVLLNTLLSDQSFMSNRIRSPAHTLFQIIATSHLRPHTVEPLLDVPLKQLLEFKSITTDWGPDVGAAGTRTREQIHTARRHTLDTLSELDEDQVVAFSDGSALGNPGPCGAAAVIYLEGIKSSPVILSEAVSSLGTSYLGELRGIHLATDFINQASEIRIPKALDIFVDCTSAIASTTGCRTRESHQDTINKIQQHTNNLTNQGCTITFHKVDAHVQLEPNELADKHAQSAAKKAATSDREDRSWQTFKMNTRQFVARAWQRQWDRLDQQRPVHICFPKVKYGKLKTGLHKGASSARIRLLTGQSRLADHMHRIGLSASPNCSCGKDRQTAHHVLMECLELKNQRMHMIDSIERAYISNNIPIHKRSLNMFDILAPHHDIKTNLDIHRAFAEFIGSCHCKI